MKNILTVFNFELKEMLKKKSYRATMIILSVLAFLAVSLPTIVNFFTHDGDIDLVEPNPDYYEGIDFSGVGFVFLTDADPATETLKAFLSTQGIELFSAETALRTAITEKKLTQGFVISSATAYKYIVLDQSMYDYLPSQLESIMRQLFFEAKLREQGIDPNVVNAAQNISITASVDKIGKDSGSGFAFAYVFMFVLYMLVLLFGQLVSSSVAREKDNRTMELLITSTKPPVLIVGKVFAVGLAGVIQVSVIILAALLSFWLNKGNYPSFILEMFAESLSLPVLLVYLIFSFLGYGLYLFIFAALGSLVSKVEDVGSAVTPVTLLFVVAFFIASIALNTPASKLVVISSYVPFVALFTMPIRFMLTSVSLYEILISAIILAVTTIGIAYLSIYIYRLGSLNYGNKLKIKDIIRSFKQ